MFTGTIPAFSNLTNLQYLYLDDNSLSGAVPHSFSNLMSLQTLLLYNNRLTSFSFDAPSRLSNLMLIDVSNNWLVGSLSPSFFLLPNLQNFAASGNCLQGSLPSTICNATNLVTLSLDGLSSGEHCTSYLWPKDLRDGSLQLDATRNNNFMQGTVPACVFALPSLTRCGAGAS